MRKNLEQVSKTEHVELGTVQKRASVVELGNTANEPSVAKTGLDRAENGPSKISVTGLPGQAPPVQVPIPNKE